MKADSSPLKRFGMTSVKSIAIEGIHHRLDDYIIKPASPDTLVPLPAEELSKQRRNHRRLPVMS
jgi:hypothetical protein